MSDLFISHVEEDYDIAIEIAEALEREGYRTWYYERDSFPGPSHLQQTGRAIENAHGIFLIISPRSILSHHVTIEVARAHQTEKPFIPVLLDMSHQDFQDNRPEWKEMIGPAASISFPKGGVLSILARIINGLSALDIHPTGRRVPSASKTNGETLPNENFADHRKALLSKDIVLVVNDAKQNRRVRTFNNSLDRRIIIGRGPECEVRLNTIDASRKHAMIIYAEDSGWSLMDIGSTNGTYLQKKRIRSNISYPLRPDNEIQIGDNQIIIRGRNTIHD